VVPGSQKKPNSKTAGPGSWVGEGDVATVGLPGPPSEQPVKARIVTTSNPIRTLARQHTAVPEP